jgi:hypothetical protein
MSLLSNRNELALAMHACQHRYGFLPTKDKNLVNHHLVFVDFWTKA